MYCLWLLLTVWQRLENWDKWLFVKLNSKWTNPFLDAVLPYCRDPLFWVPVYIFILAFITLNFGKKGVWWSLAFLCTVAITDGIGAKVFKEGFERVRPCNEPTLSQVRLLLKQCSGSFSFVSNHAANHFGIATYAFLTFRGLFRNWMLLGYLWAILICYAQVYVGVHYPLDVLGGALLGVLAGALTAKIFEKLWGNLNLDHQLK